MVHLLSGHDEGHADANFKVFIPDTDDQRFIHFATADNVSSNYTVFDSGEASLDITPQVGVSEQKPDIDQSTLLTTL